MPTLIVLSTGGTIASRRAPGGAARPALTGAELLADLPGDPLGPAAHERPTVVVRDVLATDSSSLTLPDLDAIRDAVIGALTDPNTIAVVVTHGTDTMEETALLVDLGHADPRPVVFTGAQHGADSPAPDGPANLAAALAVAADPRYRNHGVLLAFAGVVQAVRGMSKASTVAAQPFAGGTPAPLPAGGQGHRLLVRPAPITGLRVDIVASYPGADAALLTAALAAGAHAIVLAGTGSANMTADLGHAVRDAVAAGVPVVLSTRVPFGEVEPIYGGDGGAHTLASAGALISRRLRPGQARIALLAMLAAGLDREWIAAYFAN